MKTICYIIAIMTVGFLTGCEDPVSVDTETQSPKIVVDAAIKWQKGTPGNDQTIVLTTTANYFENRVPVVSGASVSVQNSVGTTFDFIEEPGTGRYRCLTFIPEIGETYTLSVQAAGTHLTATETLVPVAPIETVLQALKPGIGDDKDQIEVRAFFTDPFALRNFYLFRVKNTSEAIPELNVFDDEFFDGNRIFGLYFNEDLAGGDQLDISLEGISELYYNYMLILVSIAGQFSGGPFSTPPATLHGNIYNTANPDDFGLGYFSLSEIDTRSYTVE